MLQLMENAAIQMLGWNAQKPAIYNGLIQTIKKLQDKMEFSKNTIKTANVSLNEDTDLCWLKEICCKFGLLHGRKKTTR